MTSATAPRAFAALHNPAYRSFFINTALVMTADAIEHVISYWILYEKFRSPTLGGIAILTHWLPFLFLSVYFGALADRYDVRRLMQLGMVCFMAASAGWGILFATDSLQPWHAVVLLCIHGMAGVLWVPAGQMLIHDIVGKNDLQSAVRLASTARQLGLLLGPAIGGGAMLLMGPTTAILLNVLLYVPLIIWLARTPHGAPKPKSSDIATKRSSDILAALRDVRSHRVVLAMTVLAGGASLFVGNAYQAQMPQFAADFGHGDGDWHYSLLLVADAAGALTAGLLLESRGLLAAKARSAVILAALWCLAMAGFALTTSYVVAIALLVVGGFLNLAFSAMAQTLVQMHAPVEVRGRIIGLFSMASLGLRAFSGLTVGVLGSLIGIHWSLAISALTLLALTIVLLSLTSRATAP